MPQAQSQKRLHKHKLSSYQETFVQTVSLKVRGCVTLDFLLAFQSSGLDWRTIFGLCCLLNVSQVTRSFCGRFLHCFSRFSRSLIIVFSWLFVITVGSGKPLSRIGISLGLRLTAAPESQPSTLHRPLSTTTHQAHWVRGHLSTILFYFSYRFFSHSLVIYYQILG